MVIAISFGFDPVIVDISAKVWVLSRVITHITQMRLDVIASGPTAALEYCEMKFVVPEAVLALPPNVNEAISSLLALPQDGAQTNAFYKASLATISCL